jgi:hypothetical protein
MIRQENVTSRDLELLNVALDHALTPQEQVEFDQRLCDCPYLTALYRQQRRLKSTMGQLPSCKVPHNFTLTRAEARKAKRGGFLQPVFGWASAISALLVAVIFGSQLIFNNVSLTAPMSEDSAQTTMLREGPPTEAVPEEGAGIKTMASEPVYLLNWNSGYYGIGGKGGGSEVYDTGGVSINIYIDPNALSTGETAAMEGVGAGEIIEPAPTEVMAIPEAEILPETIPTVVPEATTVPTPSTRVHQAPKIYGIDPEKVGTVLKETPNLSLAQLEQPAAEQSQADEAVKSKPVVPIQVSIGLLAAALIFGLIWLYLKVKS